MASESILAHLAPLFTNQIENVATEALAHLLTQYPTLADAFLEYISATDGRLPAHLAFRTQSRNWQDTAIPDMVGLDEDDCYPLIIENKFWAYLTPNQPETYIRRLPQNKISLLLFIAPASRIKSLWQELLIRCNISLENNNSQQNGEKGQFQTVKLNNFHTLALTSWEALLEDLFKKAVQVKDEYAASDVWQVQSLCAKIEAEAFHPLTEGEIYSLSQKRIAQIIDLINDLTKLLVEDGIVRTKGYNASSGPTFYRRYMTINGHINWCIEYNEDYSRQHPPSLLWLTNSETPDLSEFLAEFGGKSYRIKKFILIPLTIPSNVERELVIKSLYQQVVDFSKFLTYN